MRRSRSLSSVIAVGVLCTLFARPSAAQTYTQLAPVTQVASGNLSYFAYDDKHDVYLYVHETAGSNCCIMGGFVGANGTPLGSEFVISTNALSVAVRPKVVYSRGSGADAFFVTYTADQAKRDAGNVFGQLVRYTGVGPTAGTLLGGTIPVSTTSLSATQRQWTGDVAFNPITSQFLVAWEEFSPAPSDVYVRLFNADGSAAGAPVLGAGGADSQGAPVLAFDWQRNRFMLAFSGDNPYVADHSNEFGWAAMSRLLDGSTAAPISPIGVLQVGYDTEAAVTYLPERDGFLIAWTSIPIGGGPRTSNGRFVSSTDVASALPSAPYVVQTNGARAIGAPRLDYDYVSRRILVAGMRDLSPSAGVIGGSILDAQGTPLTGVFTMSTVPSTIPNGQGGTFFPTVVRSKNGVIAFGYVVDYARFVLERLQFPVDANPGPNYNCAGNCVPPPAPDADGDGVPDYQDACPSVFAQTANGCPPTPIGGDFTGDNKPELTWQNANASGQVYSWFLSPNLGYAGGTFLVNDPAIPSGVGWTVVGTSDLSGDGKADLLWQNTQTGQVILFIMDGATKIAEQPIATNLAWKIVATGDMNSDGQADIVWQNFATGQVYVWFMTSSGNRAAFFNPFQGSYLKDGALNVITLGANSPWRVVGTGDVNGDGKRDIIWQSDATGNISAWYLQGTVLTAYSPDLNINDPIWKIRAVGDYNLDTHPDLIFQNIVTGDIAAFLLNGASLLQNVPVGRVSLAWTVVGAK